MDTGMIIALVTRLILSKGVEIAFEIIATWHKDGIPTEEEIEALFVEVPKAEK